MVITGNLVHWAGGSPHCVSGRELSGWSKRRYGIKCLEVALAGENELVLGGNTVQSYTKLSLRTIRQPVEQVYRRWCLDRDLLGIFPTKQEDRIVEN